MNKENKTLEFKEQISNTFLKTVSAFSNYGDGRIIFGVNDLGEIVGLDGDLNNARIKIENKINDLIKPQPIYYLIENEKDKTIILQVKQGKDIPYFYNNNAYRRNDTSTIKVDIPELKRLILKGQNIDYDSLTSKNQSLSFEILEKKLKEKLNISKITKDILITFGLYSNNIGFNNAAELVADINSSQSIDIVRFGKDINEILDRETYKSISIIEQFDKSVVLFRKYYQKEVINGIVRKKVEMIPEKAFREALANALVHRVWDINSDIKVIMYNDRIEIVSPGGLPSEISEDEFLNSKLSYLRNPNIAYLFLRLNYIERLGTGILRIKESYKNNLFKPKFIIKDNSITIILPTLTDLNESLITEELMILNEIETNYEINRKTLEDEFNLSKDKMIRILNKLIDFDLIRKEGKGKKTKYKINQ